MHAQEIWQTNDPKPTLDFIPALSRRRLSLLARIVLQLSHDMTLESMPKHVVFASRYGEMLSTTAMLRDLAQELPLSPAAFSHSVHNAIPGLWSIFKQQSGECSAISAGLDTFAMGLLETLSLVQANHSASVLMVLADEVPPKCFEPGLTEIPVQYALGVLLTAGVANVRLSAVIGDALPLTQPAAIEWHAWWLSETIEPFWQSGERHCWRWDKL